MEDKKNKEPVKTEADGNIKFTVMPMEFRKVAKKKFLSRKTIIIGGAGLGALVLSVSATLIYMQMTTPALPPQVAVNVEPPIIAETETPAATTTSEETAPSLSTPLATSTPENFLVPIIPPVSNLQAGSDTDADGLSDNEEVMYQTDATKPDTDGDGFLDGNEVFTLHSPIAPPPTTLLESGVVKTYRSAPLGYSIWHPSVWSSSSTIDGNKVSFNPANPSDLAMINVVVAESAADLGLRTWYASQYPEADINSLQTYVSKGGYQGLQDKEKLNTFIKQDKKIFIISLDLGGEDYVWYRTTYGTMLNSLKIE